MTISSDKFSDLLGNLDDLNNKQIFQVMLHLRELESEDINSCQEVMASFNSLDENGVIAVLKEMKAQFSTEDWNTLLEVI